MIRKTMIKGILTILPLYITVYVLVTLFTKLDSILQPIIFKWLGVEIVGLGFAIITLGVFTIGAIVSNTLGKWFVRQFNKLIHRVPIANKIYNGVNEVVSLVGDSEKSAFSKVVRVEFPTKGIYSIGFITNDSEDRKAIMIPTCPNISNGFLIYTNNYEELDMPVEKAIKKIISMGVLE